MSKKERKTISLSEEVMDAVYESMDYLSCSFSQAVEYAVCIAASVHRGCTVAGMTKDDVFIGAGPPPLSREGSDWIARNLGDVPHETIGGWHSATGTRTPWFNDCTPVESLGRDA